MYKENPTSESLCLWCAEPLAHGQSVIHFLQRRAVCIRCERKLSLEKKCLAIQNLKVHYFIVYNEQIEELLYRYKEQKDEACGKLFFENHIGWIQRKFKGYKIIYLPSSKEKIEERGFHHLEVMCQRISIEKIHALSKKNKVLQKHQSKENRANILKHFEIDVSMLKNTDNILLVDDVCTTGGSLLAAHTLVLPHVAKVEALVFTVSAHLIEPQRNKEQ